MLRLQLTWKRFRNHLFAIFPFTEVRLISVVQHGLAILFDHWHVAWWQTLANDVVSDRKQSTTACFGAVTLAQRSQGEFNSDHSNQSVTRRSA